MVRIGGLYIYPVKALGAIALQQAEAGARGLNSDGIGDRQWMLVEANDRFITQREEPKLAALTCSIAADRIRVTAPDGVHVAFGADDVTDTIITASVWKDTATAQLAADNINQFFSDYLGRSVRLVYMGNGMRMRGENAVVGQSFADGHPILTCNSASLDDLNTRLASPVGMDRFRPNLVIESDAPWAEDTWRKLRTGGVELLLAKPCPRCVVTTIDQQSGVKTGADPLQTLVKFRFMRTPEVQGAIFGQDTVVLQPGLLRVGDEVTVAETQAAPEFMVRAS